MKRIERRDAMVNITFCFIGYLLTGLERTGPANARRISLLSHNGCTEPTT
jgi:hypothetical protein